MSNMQLDPKILNNSKYIIKDLVQGDNDVALRSDFLGLSAVELKASMDLLLEGALSEAQKMELLLNMWRINYRVKPPTIQEFLTPEWLGPTADYIFPHVSKVLTEYFEPGAPYHHLMLATGIGVGKTFLSCVWAMYVTSVLWSMRDPTKFYNLPKATSIVQALISFTMDKAEQLLVQPFMRILLSSPKFKRVKMEERLESAQLDNPDQVCFTTAGRMGVIQFYNDIHYMVTSAPENLLGLNLITSTMSEISFFVDKGFSVDYINRIYQDSKKRIYSRFRDRFLSGTVIDSSPNDVAMSPIDKYIFEGAAYKNPQNYILTGPQWDFLPQNFPIWQNTYETFPVFRGESGRPPEMITEEVRSSFSETSIIDVPIDAKLHFEEDLLKSIKDIAGWPSGSAGVLIRDAAVIENMFSPQLKNIYTSISVPSKFSATDLIWNIVRDIFFIPFKGGYEFYRNPQETRYIHIDQAETGDMASICAVHPELNKKGEIIYISDFTIAISPEADRINLYAILLFIKDLREKGHMNIGKVTFDQYQSSTTRQVLKEDDFLVERLSPDIDINIYRTYISMIQSGRMKSGRNIFLKNNLKSLQEVRSKSGKKKVDHTKGKTVYYDGAIWETSQMGQFAKDVTDTQSSAVWNAIQCYTGVPHYTWTDDQDLIQENAVMMGIDPETKLDKPVFDKMMKDVMTNKVLNELSERYGFELGRR